MAFLLISTLQNININNIDAICLLFLLIATTSFNAALSP